jgi:hypothetical protein
MKNKISVVLAIIIFLSVAPMFTLGAFSGFVRMLVEPTLVFNNVYTFRDGMAWVQRDGKVGFVNQYGEFVIPLEFDSASYFFCEGLARVGRGCNATGWEYGFIDMTGELVIPYMFSSADCFHNGVARATIRGKTGIIDTTGQVVVPFEYTSIGGWGNWGRPFTDGLAVARIGDWSTGRAGVIDITGNIIIPFEFSGISIQEGGLIYARQGEGSTVRAGILNRHGEVVVPFEYGHIESFHEGLAAVSIDGKVGFIDESGELVIPLQHGSTGIRGVDPRWWSRWSHHGSFEDGFAVIGRNLNAGYRWEPNEYGLIDRMGNVVLPFEFDLIHSFSEGLAVVGVGEVIYADDDEWGDLFHTYGVIDTSGNFVIPMGDFDYINSFSGGVATASRDGQVGLIDRDGNVILPFEYNWIGYFENGMASASKDGQHGLIDRDGNVLIPFGEFSSIGRFENGVATARQDGKIGIIDRDGNVIEPFIYSSISRINDEVRLARRNERWDWTGPIDFIDNEGQVIYELPEEINVRRCMNPDNSGLLWVYTGDRENGFQFGILEIASESAIAHEIASESEQDTCILENQDTYASEDNSFGLFGFALIACCVILILAYIYFRKRKII